MRIELTCDLRLPAWKAGALPMDHTRLGVLEYLRIHRGPGSMWNYKIWSGMRESNSRTNLGKVTGYHYINPAKRASTRLSRRRGTFTGCAWVTHLQYLPTQDRSRTLFARGGTWKYLTTCALGLT